MLIDDIKKTIQTIPNFPKPGIMFKDITPVFQDAALCKRITDEFAVQLKSYQADAIIGIESRGFLFGFSISQALNIPFVMVRKAGKLPNKTVSCSYELEYATAKIEMHTNVIKPGMKVLIHDDILATGGTSDAAAQLVTMEGGIVSAFCFLSELKALNGRDKLMKHSENILSLVSY